MASYGFFYGHVPNAAARDASSQASTAASDARRARSDIEVLTGRVERLALMTEALWGLLRERLGATGEELIEIAREIDLSDGRLDGRLDGRVRRTAAECPGCMRMVSVRHQDCLYCGTQIKRSPFTDV